MSNVLFGLNIAQIVNDSIASAGGVLPAVLIKRQNTTRAPANVTGGRNPTSTRHSCQGFLDNKASNRQGGSLSTTSTGSSRTVAAILGASLPAGIVPEHDDQIEIEGRTYTITGTPERDPAAALYECELAGGLG